jgi:hypothetical protein
VSVIKDFYRAARIEAIFRESETVDDFRAAHHAFMMSLSVFNPPRHGGWSISPRDAETGWYEEGSGSLRYGLLEEDGVLRWLYWLCSEEIIAR